MTLINIETYSTCFLLIVLLSVCNMGDTVEVPCIQRTYNECEVDPSVCPNLNDVNTANEDNIIIPSYESVKDTISIDILCPTNLTHVPRFILRKFPKLRQIRMMNTGITSLNVGSFLSGHSLTQLDLRSNQISTVPANVFANLNRLEHINLAYNKIARVEPGAFDQVPALRTVILSNNLLQTIESRSFNGAGNLTELYFESNEIQTIETGALNLPKLEIISLKDNRLTSLPKDVFGNAERLEKVDLSNNALVEIGDLFNDKTSLYSLSLSNNPDVKDADLFKLTHQIPNLSYLYLANTGLKLTNEPKEPTKQTDTEDESNYSLTYLDLSSNNLNSPDIFLHLTQFKSLKTISLNNNDMTHLNHIALLKGLFSRLDSIEFKYNSNVDLNWLRRAVPILKKQNIRLIMEQQLSE
ncbi:ras suppressor protein 1-like [Sitodiplosis mosellana]|uniref:ras suppressor protein 1-like n=1 Tax=Sitodiplosis mosellana TaxID=263140 RepID=UPI002443B03A|nr:ras suppressor protein 1-like [Sitodiplosis mosellana]